MSQHSDDANAANEKYKVLRGPATANFAKEPERRLEPMTDEIKDALAHAGRIKGIINKFSTYILCTRVLNLAILISPILNFIKKIRLSKNTSS